MLNLRCTAVGTEAGAQAVHLAAIAAGWRADSLSVQGKEDSAELSVEMHADVCLPPASTDRRTPGHEMEAVLQHLAAETGSNRETPSDVGSRASAESTRATHLPETAVLQFLQLEQRLSLLQEAAWRAAQAAGAQKVKITGLTQNSQVDPAV